jgi:hypothetical protein
MEESSNSQSRDSAPDGHQYQHGGMSQCTPVVTDGSVGNGLKNSLLLKSVEPRRPSGFRGRHVGGGDGCPGMGLDSSSFARFSALHDGEGSCAADIGQSLEPFSPARVGGRRHVGAVNVSVRVSRCFECERYFFFECCSKQAFSFPIT